MFDREIYLLAASFDSCFKERIEVIPPVEHIHQSWGGYCSLQDVIFLQPPPCFPVEAKCCSSEGDFRKGVWFIFFSPNTGRSVLEGKRTILHLLWIVALNHLVGKQEILPELFETRWHAFLISVPSSPRIHHRLLLITVCSFQVLVTNV